MKKIIYAAAAFLMICISARGDEGMWLLPMLQQMNGKSMSELGCRLTPEQIYSINNSSLKDAIVQFGGGCTGEMISDRGLLVTNHHCGYGSIQKLSSTEHNYLEDGFWAMTEKDEMPVPGLTVTFLESLTDITKPMQKVYDEALKTYKDSSDRDLIALNAMREAAGKYEKEVAGNYPGCKVKVTDFYNQNVFYLIVYKVYTDVRFVGAPPASLGKFGGNTDNWMWPRHTCDFSMFRVYAGKDNEPAEYSESNVPYTPKKSLKISLNGIREGDFTMIMGYPGSTQRFQTADQLENMLKRNDIAVKARTVRQAIMLKGMEADPAVRLKYANKFASSANGWKKWQGEKLAVDKLDIIGRQRHKEAEFMKWVNRSKKRKRLYGTALQDIKDAIYSDDNTFKAQALLTQSLVYNIGPVNASSEFIISLAGALKAENPDTAAAIAQAFKAAGKVFKDYDTALERNITKAMLKFYRDNAEPEYYLNSIGDFKNMDIDEYADNLFKNSFFASPENLAKAEGKTLKELYGDPVIALQTDIADLLLKLYVPQIKIKNNIAAASKIFTSGLMEWKRKEPSYPDANSTMRLTYGTVKSYSPKNGVMYKYQTTLKGVMEKENPDDYEFRVPAKLKALYNAKDYGRYADNGTLYTCFLTNNDITGGNSGSPVLNADGALIGLAFDGNWESMSSDIMFEPELQRCICVDIRYVLFIIDKFGGAGHLIDEMNIID
jgi:hypothetical protein